MADEPRIHHYLPQGYLRGFGWKRGQKQWYVHAIKVAQSLRFQPNIKGICAERDFMRVDVEGQEDPFVLEKALSKFETQVTEAIVRVADSRKFEGRDRTLILNLMALFAVRSPQMRENMRESQERVAKQLMSLVLESQEHWDSIAQPMKTDGVAVNDSVSYVRAKEFNESGRYTVEVSRERHIESEGEMHDVVLQLLAQRHWKLYCALEDHGTFITSDRPVVLSFDCPENVPQLMRQSPGFGLQDTEVVFPLTSRYLLVGRFDGEDAVEDADTFVIGYFNSRVISHCFDRVFSQTLTFPYVIPPNELCFDDLIERAASQGKRESLS